MPEAQTSGEFMAQETCGMFEGEQRLLLLLFGTPDADFYAGMFAVGRDVHFHDIDREEPRIGGLKSNQFREFLAHCFRNS